MNIHLKKILVFLILLIPLNVFAISASSAIAMDLDTGRVLYGYNVNEQRLIIFEQRMDIIKASDVSEEINYLREEKNRELIDRYIPEKTHIDNWDIDALQNEIERIYAPECVFKIVNQTIVPIYKDLTVKVMNNISDMVSQIPIYKLKCTISDEAPKVVASELGLI